MHRLLAWLPAVALLSAILLLLVNDVNSPHEQPFMRLALNFVFSTLVSLFIAYLTARTFLVRGTIGLLLFGCGVLLWGLGGFASSIASNMDPGLGVTVHNICVCLSAVCHLIGTGLSLRPRRAVHATGLCLSTAYAIAVVVVVVVLSLTLGGWVPTFFVQGKGGTPLRYFVLSLAIALFLLTAALLRLANRTQFSVFAHWYSLGLVLTAVGLLGIMMQTAVGSLMSWVARTTQYLGGIYMLISAVASARQTREWGVPLEDALSDVKQQYEELFALAADGIVVYAAPGENAVGNFAEANPAVCALLGYTREEMRDLSLSDIMALDENPAVPVQTLLIGSNSVSRFERTLIAKDGRRIAVEVNNRFFSQHSRHMVMSVIRDITERRRLEGQLVRLYRASEEEIQRRKELERRLRRAVQDLQEFASAIAHDLQSPLSGVMSVAELMKDECGGRLGPDADPYISQITNGLERLHHMILDLLEYSRVGHDDNRQRAMIDLGKVLEYVRVNLATRIRESGTVITHDALPEVEGDFVRLVELFQNLIENAIKYRGEEAPRIHISTDRKGPNYSFCISDNGIGIAPSHAEEIFGVFKRLHGNRYEGTGIGLSLCKRIVETLGGRIWVESKLGNGANFHFVIPKQSAVCQTEDRGHDVGCSDGEAQIIDSTISRHAEPTIPSREAIILIVEDEDALRLAASKGLRKEGFSVIEAGDGSTALDLIRSHKDRIEMLFLDVAIPGASSREVLEDARRLIPGITVIATSSYSEEMAIASLAGRVERFIRKPYRLTDVAESIRKTVPRLSSPEVNQTEASFRRSESV